MSDAFDQLVSAWEDLQTAHGPGWYWILTHQFGDMYHGCVLAKAFRERHGGDLPLILVLRSEIQRPVAELFADRFDRVVVEPRLATGHDHWREFRRLRDAPLLGPDMPIVLHPGASPNAFWMDFLVFQNHLTWMALYEQVLQLPGDVEPTAPSRNPEHVREAAALCKAQGIEPRRAAILFPYSRSLQVNSVAHMTLLAERLKRQGLDVLTSVAGPEKPIAGTRPIFIPFQLLVDVAEFAGRTISVRSGIDDILSSARALKTSIYPNMDMVRLWDLGAMGLGRDTRQVVFNFASQEPESFPDAVLNGPFLDGRLPLRTLSDEVCAASGWIVETARFPDWQWEPLQMKADVGSASRALQLKPAGLRGWRRFAAARARGPGASAVPIARVVDIPPRDHPRWAEFIGEALTAWVSALPGDSGLRFYACRDVDHLDFLEEVDRRGLKMGLYRAARTFHTVLAVRGPALESSLPSGLASRVLRLERVALPYRAEMADLIRSSPRIEQTSTGGPLSLKGLQLLDGWYEPESFGIWTRGLRSLLKLALIQPAQGGLRVTVRCGVVVGDTNPEVSVRVVVNGAPVTTQVFKLGDGPKHLIVDIPEALSLGRDVFWIRFEFPRLLSPAQQGHNDDVRLLGLGMISMQIEPI
ncbi:hypothetical protein [Caulobacter sp. S45]|uniref:hypothetical protein n=1 Tax=Caulobacter sp. S45 TaxID=1641861 RepID=UPI001576E900|nr:hypothetical protein [Caulobacter sp. S45]